MAIRWRSALPQRCALGRDGWASPAWKKAWLRARFAPKPRYLAIGGVFPGQGEAVVRHRLMTVVWEHWQLDELESAARAVGAGAASIPVHLEIDTGMSRQGVSCDDLTTGNLDSLRARFTADSPLRLDGVMTHLFAADESNGAVTEEQLARLDAALAKITVAGLSGELKPTWLNVGNSAALLSGQAATIAEIATKHRMKAMLRPGLALYGLTPRFAPDEPASVAVARTTLQPVLSWKTRVVSVRNIEAGAVVGYNGTFVATEPMRLALVAVGYGDGLDRRLGNRFSLLVGGQHAPIVGRISMDQTVLDVTEIPDVVPGDEVVILGEQGGAMITAFDHADAAETIPWEIFTRIAARVARVAV